MFWQPNCTSAAGAQEVQPMARPNAGCCQQVQLCCCEPRNLERYVIPPKLDCCHLKGPSREESRIYCTVPRSRPRKKDSTATLGDPVGILRSSSRLDMRELTSSKRATQTFATCLKAFAKTFLVPVIQWHTLVLDRVIFEGQKLYNESVVGDDTELDDNPESRIKRKFDMDGCVFEVALGADFECFQNRDLMVVANLRPALKEFFRTARHCLVYVAGMYFIIWKTKGVFIVFDFYGRRLHDLKLAQGNGWAVMISLRSIGNVAHLLGHLSELDTEEPISLRELKMVRLTRPNGRTETRELHRRENEFAIVDSDYAFLKAGLHLPLNRNDPMRNRSALPLAIATLIASKIDPPATWNRKMLDKLICFAFNLCKSTWDGCLDIRYPIDLGNFPRYLKIGQFVAYFSLEVFRYSGIWRCVPKYKQNGLARAIAQSFEDGHNMLVLQIDQQIYAIWTKHSYIYMMDPYRHRLPTNTHKKETDNKSASLRMFRSMDTFFRALTDILLESNHSTKFSIHSLRIKKIENGKIPELGMSAVHEDLCENDADVISLNENICFEDDEVKCSDVLEEVSDFEDERSSEGESAVSEEESAVSEEETVTKGMEEEEGGAENFGEMDDDDNRGRKRTKSGRGGGKGSRGKERSKRPTGKKMKRKTVKKSKKPSESSKKRMNKKMKKKTRKGSAKPKKDPKREKEKLIKIEEDKKEMDKGKTEKPYKIDPKLLESNETKNKDPQKKRSSKNEPEKEEKPKGEVATNEKDTKNDGRKKLEEPKEELPRTAAPEKIEKEKKEERGNVEKPKLPTTEVHEKTEQKKEVQENGEKPKLPRTEKPEQKKEKAEREQLPRTEIPQKPEQKKEEAEREQPRLPTTEVPKTTEEMKEQRGNREKPQLPKPGVPKKTDQKKEEERGNREQPKLPTTQAPEKTDKKNEERGSGERPALAAEEPKKSRLILRQIDLNNHNKAEYTPSRQRPSWEPERLLLRQVDVNNYHTPEYMPSIQRKSTDYTWAPEDYDQTIQHHTTYNPNQSPGLTATFRDISVVGSETGSYESIRKLLRAGFGCTDRVFLMTPWWNYVIFLGHYYTVKIYFLFNGCICEMEKFRRMDLSCGTAGLLCFSNLHNLILHMLDAREDICARRRRQRSARVSVSDICREYCG